MNNEDKSPKADVEHLQNDSNKQSQGRPEKSGSKKRLKLKTHLNYKLILINVLFIIIFAILYYSFISYFLISRYLFRLDFEMPLYQIKGIDVNDEGYIGVFVQQYQRVQIYDKYGNYYSFLINESGGRDCKFHFNTDNTVSIYTAINQYYLYTIKGRLLVEKKITEKEYDEQPSLKTKIIKGNFKYYVGKDQRSIIKENAKRGRVFIIREPKNYSYIDYSLKYWIFAAIISYILMCYVNKLNKKNDNEQTDKTKN